MAYGNWDDVLCTYNRLYSYVPSIYADHVRAMIELVPTIRNLPELADVVPWTSLLSLLMKIDNVGLALSVWCERYPDQYCVYLYSSRDNRKLEEVTVAQIEVVATILFYVRKLRLIAEKNKYTL